LISVSLGDASAVTRRDGARFGLAKNERLIAEIATELDGGAAKSGRTERRFKSFMWTTRRTRAGGASAPASGMTNPTSNTAPSRPRVSPDDPTAASTTRQLQPRTK
jgi:hypothetical protein